MPGLFYFALNIRNKNDKIRHIFFMRKQHIKLLSLISAAFFLAACTSCACHTEVAPWYATKPSFEAQKELSGPQVGTAYLFPGNSSELETRPGMTGRLYIPEDQIDVAVFDTREMDAGDRQRTVDREDSAAMFYLGEQCVIGDHNLQGFQNIRQSEEGKTIAYFQKGNETEIYRCIETGKGVNTGSAILDRNGKSVKERNDESILLYTCNENWQNISYTVWEQIPASELFRQPAGRKICSAGAFPDHASLLFPDISVPRSGG